MRDETFGQRLQRLMTARSLRGAGDLERATGIPRSYIGYLLKDERNPGRKTLGTLADYFGVSTDELQGRALTGPDDPLQRIARKLALLVPDDQLLVEAIIERLAAAPLPLHRPAMSPLGQLLPDHDGGPHRILDTNRSRVERLTNSW